MFRLLVVYLLPFYLALIVLNLFAPNPAWEMLFHFSWVMVLVVASVWSIAKSSPSIEERLAPKHIDCPHCGTSNDAERVVCYECMNDLYTLDEKGNMTPRVTLLPLKKFPPRTSDPKTP